MVSGQRYCPYNGVFFKVSIGLDDWDGQSKIFGSIDTSSTQGLAIDALALSGVITSEVTSASTAGSNAGGPLDG